MVGWRSMLVLEFTHLTISGRECDEEQREASMKSDGLARSQPPT